MSTCFYWIVNFHLLHDKTSEKETNLLFLRKSWYRLQAIFYCWRNCYWSPLCVAFSPIINHSGFKYTRKNVLLALFFKEAKNIFIFRLLANDVSINLLKLGWTWELKHAVSWRKAMYKGFLLFSFRLFPSSRNDLFQHFS